MTAKANYDKFISDNQMMPETTKQECEEKLTVLHSDPITFATIWTIFWFFAGAPTFGIAFIFAIIINMKNSTARTNHKNTELMRIQNKINKFSN